MQNELFGIARKMPFEARGALGEILEEIVVRALETGAMASLGGGGTEAAEHPLGAAAVSSALMSSSSAFSVAMYSPAFGSLIAGERSPPKSI